MAVRQYRRLRAEMSIPTNIDMLCFSNMDGGCLSRAGLKFPHYTTPLEIKAFLDSA